MIKAVIFDCWNTVFYTNIYPHPFDSFANLLGESFDDYTYIKKFEKHFMLEKHIDCHAPILSLLKELKIKPTDELMENLEHFMRLSKEKVIPYPDTLDVLETLKGKYTLGLITNTDYLGYKTLQDRFQIDTLFDITLASYKLGIAKPNPKIFSKMISKLNINPGEALMVGDSYEDDFEASKTQGMNAILVDRKNKYQKVDKKVASLTELLEHL